MTDALRLAAIDVGSNSVRLLVADAADSSVRPLLRISQTTRLQAGLIGGALTRDAIEQTARAVADFAARARALNARRILAFGTSAMRDAANRDELAAAILALSGVEVETVPGEREAALAMLGAAPSGGAGLVDIGGGSAELIVGRDGRPLAVGSAPIGAVRLTRQLPDATPAELLAAALAAIEPLAQSLAARRPGRWLGVGGTITTLAAMSRRLPKEAPGAVEGCPLSLGAVERWVDLLCARRVHLAADLPGLSPQRAEIIPAGAAILLAVMRRMAIPCLYASLHDNLEGRLRAETQNLGDRQIPIAPLSPVL